MRTSGGRLAWHGKNWSPSVGMVGNVVHYWSPHHADQRYRTRVSRTVYLVEIGEHYVPVGEHGINEYNQITDADESIISALSNHLQQNFSKFEQNASLTVKQQLSTREINEMITKRSNAERSALAAVSSSSSEDENDDDNREDDEIRRTILKMMLMSQNQELIVSANQENSNSMPDEKNDAEISQINKDFIAQTQPQTPISVISTTTSTVSTPTSAVSTPTSAIPKSIPVSAEECVKATNSLDLTSKELNASNV